jgi:hypothetical protein
VSNLGDFSVGANLPLHLHPFIRPSLNFGKKDALVLETEIASLQKLAGETLTAINFSETSYQLIFEEAYLIAYTPPLLQPSDSPNITNLTNYEAVFEKQLGKIVQSAGIIEAQELFINFEDGTRILILLHPSERAGAETVWFSYNQGSWIL